MEIAANARSAVETSLSASADGGVARATRDRVCVTGRIELAELTLRATTGAVADLSASIAS